MRNDGNDFNDIYKNIKQLCEENCITIPDVKKKKSII